MNRKVKEYLDTVDVCVLHKYPIAHQKAFQKNDLYDYETKYLEVGKNLIEIIHEEKILFPEKQKIKNYGQLTLVLIEEYLKDK